MGKSKNLTVGCAISVISQSSNYSRKKLSFAVDCLLKYIEENQILIQFNEFGEFSSLAMWANVSIDISRRLVKHGTINMQPQEINTGNETWLIDIYNINGSIHQLLRVLRDEFLLNSSRVTYSRIKNGKRIAKRISRSDCTSFFQNPIPFIKMDTRFLSSREGAGMRQAAADVQAGAVALGEAVMLARKVPEIANLPTPQAVARLERPGKLLQRRMYRDTDGQLYGYVTWAWLDAELAHQGVPAPQDLALHQWNEGAVLLLCDAFVTTAGFATVYTDLVEGLFPGEAMHLRPGAPHGTSVPVIRITRKVLEKLNESSADNHAPVIDLLNLLRVHLSSHDGVST
jgi:hemolysin-activating ACP:hemolysin acyltransferase